MTTSNDNDGRTFLDDLFDKAEEAVGTLEKYADGDANGVLPITYDDGSRIIVDAIAGGRDSTDGEPNWLILRFCDPDGKSHTRRYRRAPVTLELREGKE